MKINFKKLTSLLLALVMLLAFAACGEKDEKDNDKDDKKDKTELIEWYGDINSHWQLDESGEKTDEGEHNVVDEECTVCYADFFDYGNGETYFSMPNKFGQIKYRATFDSEKNILSEEFAELKYDDDENLFYEKWTDADGKLFEEVNYTVVDGESRIANDTYYYVDGSKAYTEYDEYGYSSKYVYYDESGNAVATTTYENTYDENGNRTSLKEYEDGVLLNETFFENVKVTEDGFSYYISETVKRIFYESDGSKSEVKYVNDSPVEEIVYDASGAEISKTLYTNDDEGNNIFSKTYENGVLVREATYALYSDGWGSYKQFVTEYESDGSKTVYEYDEYFSIKTVTKYDANGKIIG